MHRKTFLELWNSDEGIIMAEVRRLRTKMTGSQLCLYYFYLTAFITFTIGIFVVAFYGLYLLISQQ